MLWKLLVINNLGSLSSIQQIIHCTRHIQSVNRCYSIKKFQNILILPQHIHTEWCAHFVDPLFGPLKLPVHLISWEWWFPLCKLCIFIPHRRCVLSSTTCTPAAPSSLLGLGLVQNAPQSPTGTPRCESPCVGPSPQAGHRWLGVAHWLQHCRAASGSATPGFASQDFLTSLSPR